MTPTETTVEKVGGKAAMLFELERAGFRIPKTFCSPDDLPAAVEAIGGLMAVRSSCTLEDGAETSFAGQFESYLSLETLEEVEDAIRKCEESAKAPSVVEYCKKNRIPPEDLQMKVIIQQLIQPELAGVCFTVNPVTGHEEVVIDAVEGLADELLHGKVESLPQDNPLMVKWRPTIEEVARKVHRHFGAPQDIEFAIQDGDLYLLQSRPITRITFSDDFGEWTNADFRDGGVSSDVCTPLMWSLYDWIWDGNLKAFLREIKLLGADTEFQAGEMFFGRPYWNMGAVKTALANLPGFVERDFDEDLSIEVEYDGQGNVTPVNLWTVLKAIPTLLAISRLFKEVPKINRAFIGGGYKELEARYLEIPEDTTAGFKRLIEEAYWQTESTYFRTIFMATICKTDFGEAFPDVDYPALVSALPEMSHLAPTRTLMAMAAKGEDDIAPLIEEFYYHGRRELDLRVPRWDEDPEHVRDLLEQFKKSDGAAGADPKPRYEKARAEARADVSWFSRGKFDKKLDRLRDIVWLREELRDRSSRMYHLIRKYVLRLGEERGLGDDIFFMTWQEILKDDRSNLEAAKATYESYRNYEPPNEIGSRFSGAPRDVAEGALRGIAASRGLATGIARVARTVEEASRIEKGAILICPYTDPGWTPVLNRVIGVVTESGGQLSHAAVICREYGIPAVLAIKGVTKLIRDGSTVVVDGGNGTVELAD
jgi:rifampicin phosphotransferase